MIEEIPTLDTKGLREFGLITGSIIACLFGLIVPWLFGLSFPVWPWVLAAILAIWALIGPDSLNQPYRLWMRFGMAIGWVTNRVVLSVVFFLVMLPIGFIMRTMGKDPMSQKLDAKQISYRVESAPTKPEQMNRPY